MRYRSHGSVFRSHNVLRYVRVDRTVRVCYTGGHGEETSYALPVGSGEAPSRPSATTSRLGFAYRCRVACSPLTRCTDRSDAGDATVKPRAQGASVVMEKCAMCGGHFEIAEGDCLVVTRLPASLRDAGVGDEIHEVCSRSCAFDLADQLKAKHVLSVIVHRGPSFEGVTPDS